MAEVTVAPPSPSKATPKKAKAAPKKAKAASKAKKEKAPANHPKYIEMAVAALNSLKERNGSSRQAIHKYIVSNYSVGTDAKVVGTHLKLALKRGVDTGAIKHVKGTGASGSFKANPEAKKKKEKKPKKPSAAKKAKASKPKKAKASKPKKAKTTDSPAKGAVKHVKKASGSVKANPEAKKKIEKKSPKKPTAAKKTKASKPKKLS